MRLTLEEAKTVGIMHLRLTNEMMAASHKMVLDLQEEALRLGDIKRKDPADVPPLMLAMSILGVAHVEKDDPTFQQELGLSISTTL